MKQITLKYFENGKEVSEQVTIKAMNIFQIKDVAKLGNNFLNEIKDNESFIGAMDILFSALDERDKKNREIVTNIRAEDREKPIYDSDLYSAREVFMGVGSKLMENVLGSTSLLLENAPNSLFKLVSKASGISEEQLGVQDPFTFLDVIDAVVEENDIPKLMERLKKSKGSFMAVAAVVMPNQNKEDNEKVTQLSQK